MGKKPPPPLLTKRIMLQKENQPQRNIVEDIIEASLFDIYHFEDLIYVWLIDDKGGLYLLTDIFHPEIYADASPELLRKLVKRLRDLDALAGEPTFVTRRHFYENQPLKVLRIEVSRPSVLRRIRSRLFAFYDKMDIYHSDLEIPMNYMYSKNLYPLARVRVKVAPFNRISSIELVDSIGDLEYPLPPLKEVHFYLKYTHRLPLTPESLGKEITHQNGSRKSPLNSLFIRFSQNGVQSEPVEISFQNPPKALRLINSLMLRHDPDILLSAYGDQAIFPQLFYLAKRFHIPLNLDRDTTPYMDRKIVRTGSSYQSYGNTIFRAPSYPLYGRWHIDSANSFVMKESRLRGVIELARLTRFPVQRLARSSTGIALTYLETRTAFEDGYLVPWQKSRLEEEKSAYELLVNDKGGLIYQPAFASTENETLVGNSLPKIYQPPNIYENVVQIDFSQMYPSIMVNHNISPETVNCLCCKNDTTPLVPEIEYRICTKRKGVVSKTLAALLERRRYYKTRIKEIKKELGLLKDRFVENPN
ncbi:MAG: DNA polymerase domain-containing protein, partial [Leptospirales bacterium]